MTLLHSSAFAQPLSISVVVPDPPPMFWEDYLDFQANVFIYVTNTTNEPYDVKLIPQVTSDQGISFYLPESFQPATSVTIPPTGTVTFSFNDLEAAYGALGQNDFVLEGITWQDLYQSETLPEGYYTLCVTAYDYNTGEALSSQFGCDMFLIQQHEPPFIINPNDDANLIPTQPQFVNFLWTTTGIPGQTRYRFQLMDLTELDLVNPEDAFNIPGILPYYQEDNIMPNTLIYDLSKPPLMVGHEYAIQVTAYDPFGNLVFKEDGKSLVHSFTYAPAGGIVDGNETLVDPGGGSTPDENPIGGDLIVQEEIPIPAMVCDPAPVPANNTPYAGVLSVGMQVQLGHFQMELLTVNGANPVSGTGRVLMPLWNTYVPVSFENLHINTALEAYNSADVVVAQENSGLIPEEMYTNFIDPLTGTELSELEAEQIVDFVENAGQVIDPANPVPPVNVPIPFGFELNDISMVVTGIQFTADGAVLNAFAKVEVPDAIGSRRILLAGKGICATNSAIGSNGQLQLLNDQVFELSTDTDFELYGGAGNTELFWDENGIDHLSIDGALVFSNGLIATGGTPLTASFQTDIEDFQNWETSITLSQNTFTLPGLDDFSMTIANTGAIVLDHSEVSSPAGFQLPGTHPFSGQENLWKGLYIPDLSFEFPSGIEVEVDLEDIILDAGGLWAQLNINQNLLALEDGSLGGWNFGVDGITLDIRNSSIHDASFNGEIQIPISDQTVTYTCPISAEGDFNFSIDLGTELNVPMWVAELNLAPNSSVGVENTGGSYAVTATLHGNAAINWNSESAPGDDTSNSVSGFSLPGLDFSNFIIVGDGGVPEIQGGEFALDMEEVDQSALNGFPLQFVTDDPENPAIAIIINGNEVGLALNIGLKLTEIANGFDGSTAFTIYGNFNGGSELFEFDRTEINNVSINANLGVLSVAGSIQIYNCDPTYGNGFDGEVKININHIDLLDLDMRLQVGKTNCGDGYRYFYFDAMVKIPGGIPVPPSGLAFYGFGGGFYYNMTRTGIEEQSINDFPDDPDFGAGPGEGGGGVTYEPSQGNFGFIASVVIGIQGAEMALNGDLTFQMELGNEFNLVGMWMDGNVYVMQPMDEHEDGDLLFSIHGYAHMAITPPTKEFSLNAGLEFKALGGLSEGSAELDVYFSPEAWHVNLGQWTEGYSPNDDPGRIRIINNLDFEFVQLETVYTAYFMMGNDNPPGLPNKPQEIVNLFNQEGIPLPTAGPNTADGATALGFGLGVTTSFDLSWEGVIFYFNIDYILGFDVLLQNMDAYDCTSDDFGFKNYYAQGDAFAYMHIGGGVEGKLFGKVRRFEFAEFEAAGVLSIATPNPTYLAGSFLMKGEVLNGIIKFNTDISFEYGEKVECNELPNKNIFDDIPIVSDFDPNSMSGTHSIFTVPQVAFNFPQEAFSIEEENPEDPDNPITNWFSYEITDVHITYNEDHQGPEIAYEGVIYNPQYDQEGRSCKFELSEPLPEKSTINFYISVRGVRLSPVDLSTVVETYDEQHYENNFKIGEAPDVILANSINYAVPFERQLYFLEDEANEGYFSFWHQQSPSLFRTTPTVDDGLDMDGSYSYKARFIKLNDGSFVDVNLTEMDPTEEIRFPIPTGFLDNQTVYEIDILRIYTPPAPTVADNNTIDNYVDLELVEGGNPGGGGPDGLVWTIEAQGGQGGTGGLQNIAQVGTIDQSNGFNPINTITAEPDDTGPGNPGITGGIDGFATTPGGNVSELLRLDREVKERGAVSDEVIKSLMAKKFYFRTSKYNTKSQKMASVDLHEPAQTKTKKYLVDIDPLYYQASGSNKHEVELPFIFLESGEPFDMFESQYYTLVKTVVDQGYSNSKISKYTPNFKFEGEQDWRSNTFYSDYNDGLFEGPFAFNDNAWCNATFYDPDVNGGLTPEDILPNHHAIPENWMFYLQQNPWGSELSNTSRHKSEGPFGHRLQRQFPGASAGSYDYNEAYIEFWQWGMQDAPVPSELNGISVGNTFKWLTGAMINDALPPAPPSSGIFQVEGLQAAGSNPGRVQVTILTLEGLLQQGPAAGVGGAGFPSVGGLDLAGNGTFYALIDFTEWVTVQDYHLFRSEVLVGLEELLDMSNSDELYPSVYDYNCGSLPQPNEAGFFNGGFDPSYNFYYRYWKPIRSYLKVDLPTFDYAPYPNRPAGTHSFELENKLFEVELPALNTTN